MTRTIAINGKKRAGKDWNATKLKEKLEDSGYSVLVVSFAHPIKDIIAKSLGISIESVELYKNETEDYGLEIKAYPNNQRSVTIEYLNMREILQRFGTEAMKPYFGNDVWARLTYDKIDSSGCDFAIIPDFRFPEEHRDGTITIKVVNDVIDNSANDSHSSENSLDDFKFDYIIDNTDYCDTTDQLNNILQKITTEN